MILVFKNIEQFKATYGGVSRNMFWDTLKPLVEEATEMYLTDWIGEELLREISGMVSFDENVFSGDEKFEKLIKLLRFSCAGYTDYVGTFKFTMSLGDSGKSVANPPHHQAPGKWATVAARRDAIKKGDDFLEKSLQYLEKNSAHFTTWTNSEAYFINKDLLISNAEVFTRHFPHCNGSRRLFIALLPYLKNNKNRLSTMIGPAMNTVVHAINDKVWAKEEISAEEEMVLILSRNVLARKAVVDSLPYLNINDDWRLVSTNDGIQDEDIIDSDRRNELSLLEGEIYKTAVKGLTDYLQKVASEELFPEYYNSEFYDTGGGKKSKRYKNSKENKYAVL